MPSAVILVLDLTTFAVSETGAEGFTSGASTEAGGAGLEVESGGASVGSRTDVEV